ncbi:type II secretion system protein [Ornithinibacillus halophilus]|uniref:Prepilin-type N-terminal cleavage/methylation domain-containing protein n=1 Tax=Ornithinibacillus halophilus TaxID=930117 RepID=A0A1M5EI00_9BACI|nr:type II secretion system protein [Ornithinibacillus halophilus]SHF78913.1 prepilin-type N-terminal cleavage/methylation domain-containing protein [Ornithinibacillus halophilus]
MYDKKNLINNYGFTLIEIIASIAILGMVIMVLLPIIPQIALWNNNADDELVASNLLGQIAYEIKNDSTVHIYSEDIQLCSNSFTTIPVENPKYNVQLKVCLEEDVELYRTYIQIFHPENNRLLSESYTYVAKNEGEDS